MTDQASKQESQRVKTLLNDLATFQSEWTGSMRSMDTRSTGMNNAEEAWYLDENDNAARRKAEEESRKFRTGEIAICDKALTTLQGLQGKTTTGDDAIRTMIEGLKKGVGAHKEFLESSFK